MSQVGDTSNSSPSGATAGSNSRSKVVSRSLTTGDALSTKRLKFNEHGLPVGDNSATPSTRWGDLTRTHIPVSYITWRHADVRYKNQIWTMFKKDFPDVKDNQKSMFMKKANESWKKFKAKIRVNLKGDDVAKWKENVPKNVKPEDWEAFCDNEAAQAQRDLRRKNKEIKQNCAKTTTHNTGHYGYARAAENWKKEHGREPTCAELWLSTHKVKGGDYAPHDEAFADKVKMLLDVYQASGQEETLDAGPIFDVFGKDTRGRVRCVGSTISRTAILASAFAREMLQEVNVDNESWKDQMDNLREEMEGVKSTLSDFVKNFESGKFVCVGHNSHALPSSNTTTPSSPFTPPTSQVSSFSSMVECKILSHTSQVVGYGRKLPPGAVSSVHFHELGKREVKIVLYLIKVPEYPVWGGK